MTLSTASPARWIAGASAFSLATSSAGFGAVYAWTTGSLHGAVLGGLAVLMAVGLEAAKPFAVSAALASFRSWRIGQAIAMALLAVVAIAYSLTAELSLMALTRGDAVAKRAAEAEHARQQEQHRDRTTRALDSLAPSRPAGEVKAEIAAIEVMPGIVIAGTPCGGTLNGPATKTHCPKRAALLAELARAEERQRLQSQLAETTAPGAGDGAASKAADPGAKALATYLAALGIAVPAAALSEWLLLVGVLALEIGSATAVLLYQSAASDSFGRVRVQAARPEPAAFVASTTLDTASPVNPGLDTTGRTPVDTPQRAARGRRLGTAGSVSKREAEGRIMEALEEAGGKLDGSVRGLAALIGGRKSTVHSALVALLATGAVVRAGEALVLRA